ncbi:tyrosine-type recombinase/integrase [Streptomyces tsukubensis]
MADLMSGCGMRNGEAFAVNLNNIVGGDVYRITEQVNRTTCQYEWLKHRRVGEYRDVPLPVRVRKTIEWYADRHGTVDGYLLRHPGGPGRTFPPYHIANQWKQIKRDSEIDVPEGMVVYGLRHFFASSCLSHGIPITDVAEWMGHKTIDVTFKIYRHLMPGSISKTAKTLDVDFSVKSHERQKPETPRVDPRIVRADDTVLQGEPFLARGGPTVPREHGRGRQLSNSRNPPPSAQVAGPKTSTNSLPLERPPGCGYLLRDEPELLPRPGPAKLCPAAAGEGRDGGSAVVAVTVIYSGKAFFDTSLIRRLISVRSTGYGWGARSAPGSGLRPGRCSPGSYRDAAVPARRSGARPDHVTWRFGFL